MSFLQVQADSRQQEMEDLENPPWKKMVPGWAEFSICKPQNQGLLIHIKCLNSVYSRISRPFGNDGYAFKLCCSVWELLSVLASEHLNVASETEKLT